jgi:GT2 family glycosyltransferase
MEPGLVSVIVVTWNSAQYLRRCLEGVAQQTYPYRELIVVDNASSDESIALVEPHATTILRNETNRGFSAAVNQAIAAARGAYVLLLNPDCFLTQDYVATLVDAIGSAYDLGSVTGVLMRAKGFQIEPTDEIDSAGIRMTRSGRHLDIDVPESLGRWEVFGVSGAAGMFRMKFLQEAAIDGEVLDEDFFAYREDADLAWRGRLLGWRALCDPRASAYHVRRVTPEARRELPDDINMHSVKNRFLLRIKNEGIFLAVRNAPFELTRDLVVLMAALTIEKSSLPAFGWLWRNRSRLLEKRRAVQRRRVVSDRALARWFR